MGQQHTPAIRLHKPLLRAVEASLRAILEQRRPADKVLLKVRRNRIFGSRDRRFIYSNTYDVVRYLKWFEHLYGKHGNGVSDRYAAYVVMNLLRLGNTVDEEAIEGLTTGILHAWSAEFSDPSATPDRITASMPEWLWEAGNGDYGDRWPAVAQSLNDPPVTYIRANRLKITAEDLRKRLTENGVDCRTLEGMDALELLASVSLENDALYRKGFFEFQDLASQYVAPLSDVQPGMTVLDICAGAGGKTLHLAALMENRGTLVGTDKIEGRLEQLQYRAGRSGATCIDIIPYNQLDQWEGRADRVVLDAPCTATGTIWRKPDIKWRLSGEDVHRYASIQSRLLRRGAALVRPGGKLVYATCSILHKEGELQVSSFLEDHPEYHLETERRFLPGTDRTDGFYIAVLDFRA